MLFYRLRNNFDIYPRICLSLSETYVSRVRRDLPLVHDEEILNVDQVEKKLVSELGNNVCVYERICAKYATRTLQKRSRERVLDWDIVFRYLSFFYSIRQLNEIDLNHLNIYLLRGTLSITITAYHLSHSNFCTNYIRVRTCVPLYFSNLPSSNTPFIFLLYILYIRIKFRRKI